MPVVSKPLHPSVHLDPLWEPTSFQTYPIVLACSYA